MLAHNRQRDGHLSERDIFLRDTVSVRADRGELLSILAADESLSRCDDFQVLKGANPSSVSVELISFLPNNNTVVPAVLNQTASKGNPHVDVWSVNVTDQNTLNSVESCVPALGLHGVVVTDPNERAGSRSRPMSAAARCRRRTPTSTCSTCQHALAVRRRSRLSLRPRLSRAEPRLSVTPRSQPSALRTTCRPRPAAFGESSFACSRCRSEHWLWCSRDI
jgi:hypothetical protein